MAGAGSTVADTARLSPLPRQHDNLPEPSPGSEDGRVALPSPANSSAITPIPSNTPLTNPPPGGPVRKPTFTSRLSRMFSHRGENPVANRDKEYTAREREGSAVSSYSTTDPGAGPSSSRPGPPERSPSSSGMLRNQRDGSSDRTLEQKKEIRRFALHEDGTHEHVLRNDRRQEKLSTMFSKLLGGRKDKDVPHEENQLSLMSGWIDQLKSEKTAGDMKGGPNYTQTLVEKYGKMQEVVGRGAFGIVRISHKPDTNNPNKELLYAVKEFRRRPQESPKKYNKRLTSEFCISSALRHPNVIHTLDLVKDAKGDFCEVMEYCQGGDLYTLVLAAGKLEVVEADCYFKQLMRGVEYIHEMGVAHRDLKPENLLLTTHGGLKITDFGNGECFRMAWETEAHMVAGMCGSAPYIAPEEYTDTEFDPRAVDVWACGVIYMAMRSGRHLWRLAKKDEDEFFERYLEGRRGEAGYQPIEHLHRVSTLAQRARAFSNRTSRHVAETSSTRSSTRIPLVASPPHRFSSPSGAARYNFAELVKRVCNTTGSQELPIITLPLLKRFTIK